MLIRIVCSVGALLGFEVTSQIGLLLSGSPGTRVVVRLVCLVALSGIGLLFENCIVDASIFECNEDFSISYDWVSLILLILYLVSQG